MKKYKIFSLLVLLLSILTSCIDDLDTSPKGQDKNIDQLLASDPTLAGLVSKVYGSMALSGASGPGSTDTPGDDAGKLIADAINGAHRQVLVQAFSFTHHRIAEALIAAKRRGVDVKVIADKEQTEKIFTSMIARIAVAGVPVFLDSDHTSAHNKVMVIDAGSTEATLVTGSFNFTQAAQYKNAENVLVIRGNTALTELYLKNWQHHYGHSQPYR